MTTTDRASLERALERADATEPHAEAWATIVTAARAHLETLPRTRMVEVWHVSYVAGGTPGITVCHSEEEARKWAVRCQEPNIRFICVHVTGPHSHEVPST